MFVLACDLTIETATAPGDVNDHDLHWDSPFHVSTSTRNALTVIPKAFLETVLRGVIVLMAPPLSDFPTSIGLYPAPFGTRTMPGIIRSVTCAAQITDPRALEPLTKPHYFIFLVLESFG